MMLVTYQDGGLKCGLVAAGRLVELAHIDGAPPPTNDAPSAWTMNDVIDDWHRWRAPVVAAFERLSDSSKPIGAPVANCRLVAPIPRPRRNPFLIAGNYMSHVQAGERATGIPYSQRKTAIFFTKPTGSVVGPFDDVRYDPKLTQMLDYECELVVVIARRGRDIPAADAMDFVWGYTIGNDISARDIQRVKPTPDFLRAKGLDTFFPTGPGLVPSELVANYRDLNIQLYLNGEKKQDAALGEMIRDIPEIISELSKGLTLEPGDLISTGTPSGTQGESDNPRWLREGDELVSEIEGIGRMVNHIRTIE